MTDLINRSVCRGYARVTGLLLILGFSLVAIAPLRTVVAEAYIALADFDSDPAGQSRIRNLQAALNLFPGNAQYLDRHAEALIYAGEGENAFGDYLRSVQIRPSWPYNRAGLAKAAMLSKPGSKVWDAALIQARRLGPNERNLELFLSWLQVSNGDRLSARGKSLSDDAIRFSMRYDRPRLLAMLAGNEGEMLVCAHFQSDKQFANWCRWREQSKTRCLAPNSPAAYSWCEKNYAFPTRPAP